MKPDSTSTSTGSAFPDLESFEVRVTEFWLESDVHKSKQTVLTNPSQLLYHYAFPQVKSQAERDWHSRDFSPLLASCYRSRAPEKRAKSFTYEGTVGDNYITVSAICRVTYKPRKDV